MLALKKAKKAKEEEAKRLEAEAAADEKVGDDNAKESENGDKGEGNGGIKILGIGGKSIKKGNGTNKKRSPGEIRVQKDIGELDSGKVGTVTFPNPNDLTFFELVIKPDEGFWKNASYLFTLNISADYPHKPPKVLCKTRIYHPNIDLEGNVCLNILREDWKPVLDVNAVIYGLISLFYEPNHNDPLNKEAASLLRKNENEFKTTVQRTLKGYSHSGYSFEKLI